MLIWWASLRTSFHYLFLRLNWFCWSFIFNYTVDLLLLVAAWSCWSFCRLMFQALGATSCNNDILVEKTLSTSFIKVICALFHKLLRTLSSFCLVLLHLHSRTGSLLLILNDLLLGIQIILLIVYSSMRLSIWIGRSLNIGLFDNWSIQITIIILLLHWFCLAHWNALIAKTIS